MSDVDLAIRMTADASEAADAADKVGAAYEDMGREVDAAADKSGAAADRMGSVAESADNLGSSTAQAAGGLGDLGGALSAVPGPLGAVGTGMETLAPLVMGVTGATDLLNVAAESNIVKSVRQAGATALNTAKTVIMTGVTKAAAVGQWALNAAMEANPIGLVVIAVAALVAGLVLAYNKSETFRNIVDGAMRGAKAAVGLVVDAVDSIKGKIDSAMDKFPLLAQAVSLAKTLIVGYFEAMTLPLRTLIGWVDTAIDKLSHIHIPHIPGLRVSSSGSTVSTPTVAVAGDPAAAGQTLIYLTVNGAIDPSSVAQQIIELLRRYGVNLGVVIA